MTKREFLGEEFYRTSVQEYEKMRAFRNRVSGQRPPETGDVVKLRLNRPFESFYRKILGV